MKAAKSPNHLGQSIPMGILLLLTSIGIIALMTMHSGALM